MHAGGPRNYSQANNTLANHKMSTGTVQRLLGSWVSKNRHFIAISLCVFSLAWLTSSSSGFSTKSVKRAGKVLCILPVIFSFSHFLIWRILVTRPRKNAYISNKKHEKETIETKSSTHRENVLVLHLLFQIWMLVLFIFLLFAHLGPLFYLFLGKTSEVEIVPYLSFVCLGGFVILAVILLIFEIVEFILRGTVLRGLQWRSFQKNWPLIKAVVVVLIVCGVVVVSMVNAAKGPVVQPVELPVRKLPSSMNGLRIVQLSDIHVGPTVGRSQLQQAVNQANALNPDVVVITGDLVDSTVENLVKKVQPLQQLSAKYGVFYITGNHEYYTYDVKHWRTHLESLGIVCLPNRLVRIANADKPQDWFYLAGTNDLEGSDMYDEKDEHFDLDKALEGTDGDHAIILLAHQPKAAKQAVQSQYDISLILSGHTHGGQMFPMCIVMYLDSPYYAGLYQPKEGTYVYMSSGTWYGGPPMRLFSRAEITLITLLAS